MALSKKKRPTNEAKVNPVSFRFTDETLLRLRSLSEYSGDNLTRVMENLIDAEVDRLGIEDPMELDKARKIARRARAD